MAGIERKGQQLGSIRVATVEPGTDLSTLLKADLVDLATASGIDPAGLNKAELVKALQAQEGGD